MQLVVSNGFQATNMYSITKWNYITVGICYWHQLLPSNTRDFCWTKFVSVIRVHNKLQRSEIVRSKSTKRWCDWRFRKDSPRRCLWNTLHQSKILRFYFCNDDKKQSVLVYDLVSHFSQASFERLKSSCFCSGKRVFFPQHKICRMLQFSSRCEYLQF
jgi:hypothetical protein